MSDREKFERAAAELSKEIERIRDLIAAEGEIGDRQAEIDRLKIKLEQVTEDRDKRIELLESSIRDCRSTYEFGASVMNQLVIPRVKQMSDGEIPINALNRWLFERDQQQSEIDRLKAELTKARQLLINGGAENQRLKVELEKAQDTIKGYEHTEASGNALMDALLAERDRLKEELERLAGERDTWRKRFEAQPSTYQLAAVEQERDILREELEAERRGWPIDQPLTDMPMERQIKLLNQQLVEQQMERDTLRAQLEAMTENRDHFCHHINLIAKELGTNKDNSAPEAVLQWVRTQKAQLEEALAIMDAKAWVFRSYEALHLAKLTDAGMSKAKENRNHASDLEDFIQRVKQTS